MYRERYNFTLQKLLRTKMFVLAGLSSSNNKHTHDDTFVHEIYTIASLLGSKEERVLFGVITQPEEGSWFLEDLTGVIKLDFSFCEMHSETYFYTEGSQVIASGVLANGIFCVNFIALPPPETRQASLEAYDIDDVFGNSTRPAQLNHLQELEAASVDTMFVIISDLRLDKPHVVENLTKVFQGFEQTQCQSLLFILIGDFSTKSFSAIEGRENISNNFNVILADLICSFPFLSNHAKFLIVPGSEDIGVCANILPRRAIPEMFRSELQRKVKNITFASNPCRLRFYTQEIVIFRENLCKKFQRHSIFKISQNLKGSSESEHNVTVNKKDAISATHSADSLNMSNIMNATQQSLSESMLLEKDKEAATVTDISEMVVNSLLSNGHLCPFAAAVKPIHWELDYTLRLSPIPDMVSTFEFIYFNLLQAMF